MNPPKKLLYTALLMADLVPFSALALNAPVSDDAYCTSTATGCATPSATSGNATSLLISSTNKTLLRFDLSALPTTWVTSADIHKATLFFWVNTTTTTPGKIAVYNVSNPWTPGPIIQDTQIANNIGISSKPRYYQAVDVTSAVRAWVGNPPATPAVSNFGLIIQPAAGAAGTSIQIDSKENTTFSHPAFIEIAIAGPTGPTGAIGPKGDTGAVGATGPIGSVSFADPTALIGLKAINGNSAASMRSDAAPALDQGIVPTWTGQHTWSAPGTFNSGLSATSGLSASGGTVNLNADSNSDTNINTGASTGKVNIGNSNADVIITGKNLHVQNNGHISTLGTAPIISNCGTSPGPSLTANSTDTAGSVTVGAGSSTCKIKFATAYSNVPFCVVSSNVSPIKYTVSNTLISVSSTSGGEIISWVCQGE